MRMIIPKRATTKEDRMLLDKRYRGYLGRFSQDSQSDVFQRDYTTHR